MKVATPRQAAIHIRQLGLHHFAYLRGVADGVDMQECAKRYLGIDHGHAAITMHRQVVDKLRGVARRRGEKSWRHALVPDDLDSCRVRASWIHP